jgi:hypothetical protein
MEFVTYESVLRSFHVRRERSTDGKDRCVAWFPDLEGCRAQVEGTDKGATDAAVQTLYALLPRYIAALRELGVSGLGLYTELAQTPNVIATFSATDIPPTRSTLTGQPYPPLTAVA